MSAIAPLPEDIHLNPAYEPIDVAKLDVERFRIRSPREVEAILADLSRRATVVSLHIKDSPWFLLTTVVGADRARNQLLFEHGRDEDLNQRVMNAREVRFDTYQDQINVRFSGYNVQPATHHDTEVFECSFPDHVLRLQRREFFRISPPLNQPVLIKVPLTLAGPPKPEDIGRAEDGSRQIQMHARGVDISCGGVVFLVEGNFMHTPVGAVLYGAQMELPKTADLKIDLEVRNIRFVENAGPTGTTRIGCRFSHIDSRAIALLQRYINRVQVERRI